MHETLSITMAEKWKEKSTLNVKWWQKLIYIRFIGELLVNWFSMSEFNDNGHQVLTKAHMAFRPYRSGKL